VHVCLPAQCMPDVWRPPVTARRSSSCAPSPSLHEVTWHAGALVVHSLSLSLSLSPPPSLSLYEVIGHDGGPVFHLWLVCVCVCVCRCGGIEREGIRRSMIYSVSSITMTTKRTCNISPSLFRARARALSLNVCVCVCLLLGIAAHSSTHKLVVYAVCVCVCVYVYTYYIYYWT